MNCQSLSTACPDNTHSKENQMNLKGLIPFALIFVERASFKIHNVIYGCKHEKDRMPQRQQEIAVMFGRPTRFKRIYASDQEKFKNVILVFFAPVTSTSSHRLYPLVAKCGLSAKIKALLVTAEMWTQLPCNGKSSSRKTCVVSHCLSAWKNCFKLHKRHTWKRHREIKLDLIGCLV